MCQEIGQKLDKKYTLKLKSESVWLGLAEWVQPAWGDHLIATILLMKSCKTYNHSLKSWKCFGKTE